MTTEIPDLQKSLIDRRVALALQVEIPDMAAYALEWSKLGADFTAAGWVHNAGICYSNAKRYGALTQGAYQRLLQEIPVKLIKRPDPNERTLYCGKCNEWTLHVWVTTGWACAKDKCGEYIPLYHFVEFALGE